MKKPWERVRFGEFLRINQRPHELGASEDANLVGMRLYGQGPFHRELKTAMRIAKKSHFVIRAGDVIYNKLFAWKGTFGVVPSELDGMFVSDKFPTYELDRDRVDEGYLRWYFRYAPLWEEARLMSTGSAALSKLTLNPPRFLDLTIPLPSTKTEQGCIANKIDKLAIEIDEAKGLRKQSIEEAGVLVSSFLRDVADNLSVKGCLADILFGPPRNGWSAKCDNADDGVAVLALGAVTGFHYCSTAFKRTSLFAAPDGHFWLQPNDLLITRSNTPELVGHAAIYDGNPSPCIYPDLMMRLQVNEKIASKRFVWYWLQSPVVRDFISRNAKGTSPTMKKISQGIVMNIPFPTGITLTDQGRIVRNLDLLVAQERELKLLQNETSFKLEALLPAVLDQAFKGEL